MERKRENRRFGTPGAAIELTPTFPRVQYPARDTLPPSLTSLTRPKQRQCRRGPVFVPWRPSFGARAVPSATSELESDREIIQRASFMDLS